jgi:hypothetical protein
MAHFYVTEEEMHDDKFYVKKSAMRRLSDKTARVEVTCRLRQTTAAVLLKGT